MLLKREHHRSLRRETGSVKRLHDRVQWQCPNKENRRLCGNLERVGGGGRTAFLKPLAHSHWGSRLNINQTMSLHSIKPASVFPLHFKWNPVSAMWPQVLCSLDPASFPSLQHTALCPAHRPPASAWTVCPLTWKALTFSIFLLRNVSATLLSCALLCLLHLSLCLVFSIHGAQNEGIHFWNKSTVGLWKFYLRINGVWLSNEDIVRTSQKNNVSSPLCVTSCWHQLSHRAFNIWLLQQLFDFSRGLVDKWAKAHSLSLFFYSLPLEIYLKKNPNCGTSRIMELQWFVWPGK